MNVWFINKQLLKSYVTLFLSSFLCFGHPFIQRVLLLAWLVHLTFVILTASRRRVSTLGFLAAVVLSQVPGILLIVISCSAYVLKTSSEWPNGLMETWYHPFIPVLEMFPQGYLGQWSSLFAETCLIPVGIMGLTLAICTAVDWRTRAKAPDET